MTLMLGRFTLPRISDDRSRALIFGGVNLVILWVSYVLVLGPLFALLKEQNDLIGQRAQTLGRFHVILDRAKSQLREASILAGRRPEFLEHADDGTTDASLQTLLKQKVEGSGSHLLSTSTLTPKTIDGVRYAAAHLEFAGSLGAIQAAVHAIETNVPYLFVESASFSVYAGASSLSDIVSTDVQVQIDVYCGVSGERHD